MREKYTTYGPHNLLINTYRFIVSFGIVVWLDVPYFIIHSVENYAENYCINKQI